MEILRNKRSNKSFIYVEDVDDEHFLGITPECKAKVLEFGFFSDPLAGKPSDFLAQGLISESQINSYEKYKSYRKSDREDLIKRFLESMSSWERHALIAYWQKQIKQDQATF